jgi:hypothetical protein
MIATSIGCVKNNSEVYTETPKNETEMTDSEMDSTSRNFFLESEKLDLALKKMLSESIADTSSTLIPVILRFSVPPDSLLMNFIQESGSQQVLLTGSILSARMLPSVIKELDQHDDVVQISLSQTRKPLNN